MFRFRDFTPRGFYARSLLIVLLPLVLLLIGMTWLFYDSHIGQVSRKMSQSVSGEVAEAVRIMTTDTDTRSLQEREQSISDYLRIDVNILDTPELPPRLNVPFWQANQDEILRHELGISLNGMPFWMNTQSLDSQIEVRVKAGPEPDQTLQILVDRKRAFATTGHNFIVWVILFSVLLIAIAIGFLRNQVRSVLRLAATADAWGRGEHTSPLKPSGATEVRQAARAITLMRERILAHVDQRTAMLAGVSHDLRTPLTRLKLQLALLPPSDDLKAARKDLDDMSAMLDEYLAFAKGEEGEQYQDVDLGGLASEIALSFADRAQVSVTALPGLKVRLRPLAVKRALSNLMNNATDYGDIVQLSVHQKDDMACVIVEDDGPGIDENHRDDVFKPFVRLDAARNQNQKGVGLGLALARDVARSHGGDIVLGRSGAGGLRAEFQLPLQMISAPA